MDEKMKRIDYFDTAKAYLIVLVVLGHISIVMNPGYDKLYLTVFQVFIYTFHMPAFFIIHGILFNNEKWKKVPIKDFILKRVYTYIVPYMFFEIIGVLWRAIFLNQDLLTGLYNMITIRCNVGADWFLPALFMGSLLYFIYVKHSNRIYGIVSVIISFFLPIFMSGNQLTIIIGRGLLAYGFIMIGHFGRNIFLSEKIKRLIFIFAAFMVTGVVALIGLKWAGNDFYGCVVKNPVTFVVGGISGTYMILGLSQYLKHKFISLVGRNTLTIMGTHQLIIYAMTVYIQVWGIEMGILLFIAILIFEVAVVYLLNRFLPFCIGKQI